MFFRTWTKTLGTAVQFGFKRIRSWHVPPNWSRGDWFEEVTAVGTAAAWQAVCEFDSERGVPLAGFGYCRMMTALPCALSQGMEICSACCGQRFPRRSDDFQASRFYRFIYGKGKWGAPFE